LVKMMSCYVSAGTALLCIRDRAGILPNVNSFLFSRYAIFIR